MCKEGGETFSWKDGEGLMEARHRLKTISSQRCIVGNMKMNDGL